MSDVSDNHQMFFDKIDRAFPEAIAEVIDFRGERTLVISQEHIKDVCTLIRDDDELQCDFLEDVVADGLGVEDLGVEHPHAAQRKLGLEVGDRGRVDAGARVVDERDVDVLAAVQ